ncbi:MAG: hypothetical protein ACREHD_22410, partial [Pirellulales bacterium]
YPNGRVLNYSYGVSGGIDDALSRIASLIDNDGVTHLVDYTRIGLDTFVEQSSPEPQIAWSLINGSGIDPYTGLDQFSRVVDSRWYSTATSADLDRIQHGYDRVGNRLSRKNTVASAAGVYLDELYSHDGLYRLTEMQRGELNGTSTAIVSGTLNFAQAWGLDALGNWSQFWENDSGSSWNLQQTRTAGKANEITAITGGGWAQPGYDAAGNVVQLPNSSTPAVADNAIYDAWNRMASIYSAGSLVQQSIYDGLMRRIERLASGTARHFYYSPQWQSLEERVGASTITDSQFVWGSRYLDAPVLRDRGDERFYSIDDANWNVTAIVGSAETVSERYVYSAYGEPLFLSAAFAGIGSSTYAWECLFAGYRWDGAITAYSVRRRVLLPLLGTWLSRDSVPPGIS